MANKFVPSYYLAISGLKVLYPVPMWVLVGLKKFEHFLFSTRSKCDHIIHKMTEIDQKYYWEKIFSKEIDNFYFLKRKKWQSDSC